MNTVQYSGNSVENTSRGPSTGVWADCPMLEILSGATDGVIHFDDFLSGPRVAAGAEAAYSMYRGFASTGGLVADGGELGGVLDLSSDGDDEGASFRTSSASFQIARNMGKFWFEARVKTSTIADTKHGLFVGLMADTALTATVPITAAGAIADVNIVGFHRLEGDGDQLDLVYKADGVTSVTVQADAIQLSADTWVKVGMVFEPKTNTLTFYKNGVKVGSVAIIAAAGTDFPNDVRLGLVIAVLNATASTPGSARIDWWRACQVSR
jgi:hypothetical protein